VPPTLLDISIFEDEPSPSLDAVIEQAQKHLPMIAAIDARKTGRAMGGGRPAQPLTGCRTGEHGRVEWRRARSNTV
jgi:hypothetical protein